MMVMKPYIMGRAARTLRQPTYRGVHGDLVQGPVSLRVMCGSLQAKALVGTAAQFTLRQEQAEGIEQSCQALQFTECGHAS
jgi:hypothetical protein